MTHRGHEISMGRLEEILSSCGADSRGKRVDYHGRQVLASVARRLDQTLMAQLSNVLSSDA